MQRGHTHGRRNAVRVLQRAAVNGRGGGVGAAAGGARIGPGRLGRHGSAAGERTNRKVPFKLQIETGTRDEYKQSADAQIVGEPIEWRRARDGTRGNVGNDR